jgi:MFS family permease
MVMVWTGLSRFFIIITPAFLLFTNRTELWIIYIIALFLGLMDAFAYPAETAIIPDLVEKKDLGPANALAQIIVYACQIIGPMAAGWIIAFFNKIMPETRSIGWIFVMGAVGFIISSLFFYLIKPKVVPAVEATRKKPVMALIKEMFVYMWRDPILRLVFLLALGINFFMLGPMTIGIPVLAKWSLANNVNAYGIIMAIWGIGSLLGAILGGSLPKPQAKKFGTTLLAVVALAGASVAVLGFCHSVWTISLAAGLVGLTNGYILVLFLVWLQIRTPENMMGRVISLMSFAWIGLYPVSSALCGYLLKLSPSLTLLGSGVLLMILTGAVALMPSFRKIGFVLERESK